MNVAAIQGQHSIYRQVILCYNNPGKDADGVVIKGLGIV